MDRDITFPTRLLSFVKSVQPNCAMGHEEKEYIKRTAKEMLEEQRCEAIDPDEIDYLGRTKNLTA